MVCFSFRCRCLGAREKPRKRLRTRNCAAAGPVPVKSLSGRRVLHPPLRQNGTVGCAAPVSVGRNPCPAAACCRALLKRQVSGSGKRRWSIRFPPRPPTQSGYAETRLFDRQGKAQGRRGHRHPPDRFARPPHTRKGGPDGPPFRHSIFSFDWRSVKKTCRGQVFSAAPAELISAGGNHAGAVNGGGSPAGIPRPPARREDHA